MDLGKLTLHQLFLLTVQIILKWRTFHDSFLDIAKNE